MLGNNSGQVEVGWMHGSANLLASRPARRRVRRFTCLRVQLATARAPQPSIGFAQPFEEQDLVLCAETIKQSCDGIRHGHLSPDNELNLKTQPKTVANNSVG